MFSKRELEGYVMIDHRNSDGISPEQAKAAGLGTLPVGRGTLFESSVITCSHCQCQVVLNPARTRARGYCPHCDKYVCDLCEAERVRSGECMPFKKVIDDFMNLAATGQSVQPIVDEFNNRMARRKPSGA